MRDLVFYIVGEDGGVVAMTDGDYIAARVAEAFAEAGRTLYVHDPCAAVAHGFAELRGCVEVDPPEAVADAYGYAARDGYWYAVA